MDPFQDIDADLIDYFDGLDDNDNIKQEEDKEVENIHDIFKTLNEDRVRVITLDSRNMVDID